MARLAPPPAAGAPAPLGAADQQFIDRHILRTQRSLKLVDFSSWLLTLAIGLLAFVLVAAVLDQWVVAGGLSPLARGVLFLAFFATIAWHSWRTLLPLIRPINPVYAAQAIESSSPGLKNSLLNLLLFRSERRPMSQRVYQALEHQAAQRLSTARAESAVDRTPLLRLGYALLAAFATVALYAALSPKNPLVSAGRVLAPWADIAAPSRVRILDVTPGDSSAARGERVEISAEITGAGADEPMRLHYASLDRQIEDEQVTMARSGGGARAAARIPAGPTGAAGIQQDLEYWIEAGDARSRHYKLTVFSRPTIVVQKVRYEPPSYTGDPSSDVEQSGDLHGLEGTRVTLFVLANQPIRAAHVDFDADGSRDLAMQIDGEQATVTFTLALREDRRTPLHPKYSLRLATVDGRLNDDPAVYRIDVTPDYPPEVRITKPEKEESQARVGDIVQIGVEAHDVDFALSGVKLVGRVGERDVAMGDVLSERHEGRFGGIKPFVPGDVQLKAGDVLEYWAEASDNRRPEANVTKSDRRRMRIVEDAGGGGKESGDRDQESGGGSGPDDDHNAATGGRENEENGQPQGNQPQKGEQQQGSEKQSEQQQGGQQQGGQQKGGQQQGGQQQGGQQQGREQQGGQQQGGQSQGGQQQSGGQQQGGAPQPDQSGQGGQESQSPEGSSNSGQQQGKPGDKQSSGQSGGQSGAEGQPQERVSSDGADDGKAFQKIQNHFGQDDANKGNQGSGVGGQESEGKQEEKPGDDNPVSRDAESAERSAQEGNPSEQAGDRGKNSSTSGEQSAAGKQNAGESTDPQPDGAGKDQAAADPATGDKRPGAAKAHEDKSGDGDPTKKSTGEAPDSAMNQNQGDAGSGQETGNEQGSPQGKTSINRPKSDKDKNNPEGMDDQEPASAGQDNKEGQSHGGQGGDATGGGQQGGGQHADADGTGDAGQHESADDGAGQSTESGNGETGDQAGDDKIAPGKTGSEQKAATDGGGKESGDGGQESGGGSKESGSEGQQSSGGEKQQPGGDKPVSRDAESAERSGPDAADQAKNPEGDSPAESEQSEANSKSANPGEQPSGEQGAKPGKQGDKSPGQSGESSPSEGESPESQSPQEKSQSNSNGGSSGPNNGGTAGTRKSSAPAGSPPPEEPGQADAANLEFAKKQTDLLLERLDEQLAKHKVDPALLRSLGWSEEELSHFVDRWKGLKDRAAGQGEDATKAQMELAEALRSLGLRPGGPRRIDSAAADDRLRNLREGYRNRAPLEYADRIRAYVKRAGESAE